MAGYLRAVAAVQAALVVPAAILYWHPFGYAPTALYTVLMIAAWCAAAAVLVVAAVRLARGGPRVAPGAPARAG